MSSLNKKNYFPGIVTHEGAKAEIISNENLLRRSVLSCFLWEKEFYESGVQIAHRINETASKCTAKFVADLAYEARVVNGLRHVSLLLLLNLIRVPDAKRPKGPSIRVADVIASVISRPDEMTELLAMYWLANGGRKNTSKLDRQLVKGLAKAFGKFDEYQLAKYDREGPVRLRDVMFLSHPKPMNEAQAALFKRVANKELVTPDTWEVELSAGKDKKATFERLIQEGKLGYLALLRNLRNMVQAGCDDGLVRRAIVARKGAKWVLPFRYVAAARYAPMFERELDTAMQAGIRDLPHLQGMTVFLVDVSGSMNSSLSQKSDLKRIDAAAALASIANVEKSRTFTFSEKVVECPPRKGMAGIEAIKQSQPRAGTRLHNAIDEINRKVKYDRLIVITDEQAMGSRRPVASPTGKGYIINVASYQNGVAHDGGWEKIDGFSENVLRYIHEMECLK